MRRNSKEVSASRIRHSLSLPELLVRLFVFVVCLSGIGYASFRFYDALILRIKQRALVASVDKRDPAKDDASVDKTVVSGTSVAARDTSVIAPDVTSADSSLTPETGSPPFHGNGEGSLSVSGQGQSKASDEGDLDVPAVEAGSKPESEMGSNEQLMTTDQSGREQDSTVTTEPEPIDDEFELPKLQIQDLSGGEFYDPLETHKGKVIVLDFWASWCAPCLEEMQILQDTFGEYDDNEFQLIAVNTEESRTVVEKAIELHQIESRVVLDLEGSAAAVFGVEALPTLVLIDQTGTVQRVHVGLEPGLSEMIRGEVDRLLKGGELTPDADVASRLFLANMKSSSGEMVALKVPAESLPSHDTLSDIVLANGKAFSVGEHLAQAEKRFDRFFAESSEASDKSLTSLTNEETGLPTLVFSRRGEELHGPLMSFHENGKRQSFIHYSFGKRIATQVMWDTSGRPLVMQEYRNGRKDGVRAIFKSCGGECTTAHLWVAEEWRQGKLLATHVGVGGDEMVRNEINSSANSGMTPEVNTEYGLARQQFSDYDDRLSVDEAKLKQVVSDHYKQLRREFHAQANARLIASSAITHSFASRLSSGNGRSSSQSGTHNLFSGPSMMMRNCGRF